MHFCADSACTCRHAGVEPAYRSRLIGETARAWRSLSNPNESKRFLVQHRDQLLTDEAKDTLQQDNDLLGQALLELASTDESELAYSLLERPDSRAAALADARAHADPNQLHAVALLCYATANDAAQRATAAMHLAISLAIATTLIRALQAQAESHD